MELTSSVRLGDQGPHLGLSGAEITGTPISACPVLGLQVPHLCLSGAEITGTLSLLAQFWMTSACQ